MVQKMILPLTPGLLISIALRHDHSFGISMGSFERYSGLAEKQITLLGVAMEYYKRGQELSTYAMGGEAQLWEEMTGVGFYHRDREDAYTAMALPESLREAERLVGEYHE